MKIISLVSTFLLLVQYVDAQTKEPSKTASGITSVDMEEVVIKASKPDKYIHAIRPENVFIVLARRIPATG
ncbi:MAG: hypothetical protein BGO70_16455 [Bacteroidetes bacterium 43-93]|nr:hypothetical protein [Bacteroidota bacterium]OJX01354.1 MAG: hypothetical protein BGO70_16455 [Bacteroidetes bacterium 43-93]